MWQEILSKAHTRAREDAIHKTTKNWVEELHKRQDPQRVGKCERKRKRGTPTGGLFMEEEVSTHSARVATQQVAD